MRVANAFNLNRLHSCSFSRRPCNVVVALTLLLTAEVHADIDMTICGDHGEIFECTHFKFMVCCLSKHSQTHTRVCNAVTLVWGSPVGLAQACPNKMMLSVCTFTSHWQLFWYVLFYHYGEIKIFRHGSLAPFWTHTQNLATNHSKPSLGCVFSPDWNVE